jgi:tungstate transport system ATP-binding protein
MTDASLYRILRLVHAYEGRTALRIDEFSVRRASIVGLVGPNGSGKSTLLHLLGFIHAPTEGQILFKGEPAGPFSESVRFTVTLLPQEPYLLKRTVWQNVRYGLHLRGREGGQQDRVQEALQWVGLEPNLFLHRKWYALSGGEAQRVALAARLVLRPEVLLLDEPTARVDALSAQRIKEAAMRARREWGTTLVVASHDRQWLYEVCDDVLHFYRGRIFGNGEENILFGPWRQREDGRFDTLDSEGTSFVVDPPPSSDAVAVFGTDAFSVSSDRPPPGQPYIEATISRLLWDRSKGQVIVSFLAGSQPVNARFSRKDIAEKRLYPGRTVWIGYDSAAFRWLE